MRGAVGIMLLGMAFGIIVDLPARAHVVEHAYKDVPGDHWAAEAVAEMSIRRSLMRGFGDGTFRGESLFARREFASSMAVLLEELESLSRASWHSRTPGSQRFGDIAAESKESREILRLVNDYRLWEGVPAVAGAMFHPNQVVSRAEVAQVVRNLLRLGEAKGVVLARDPRDPDNRFKDLSPAEWAYWAILGVDQRYRVMVGYPDVTFRPQDELTRYQYASVGKATFDVIRELVRRSIDERGILEEKVRRSRFQEGRPWAIALAPGYAFGDSAIVAEGLHLDLGTRYVAYLERLPWVNLPDWFGQVEVKVGLHPGIAASVMAGAFPQGPTVYLGEGGELQLQPFLGARTLVDAIGKPVAMSLSPLVVGGIAYWRLGQWSAFVIADTSPFSVGRLGLESYNLDLSFGGEYLVTGQLALTSGITLSKLPTHTFSAPTFGLNLAF